MPLFKKYRIFCFQSYFANLTFDVSAQDCAGGSEEVVDPAPADLSLSLDMQDLDPQPLDLVHERGAPVSSPTPQNDITETNE